MEENGFWYFHKIASEALEKTWSNNKEREREIIIAETTQKKDYIKPLVKIINK